MNKKLIFICLIVLVLIVGIIFLVGENLKKEKRNEEDDKEEYEEQIVSVDDKTLVKINGLEFHLDKESIYKDLKYIITEEFKKVEQSHYIQYNYYQEDQTNLLFFRIFYYNNQDNDAAIKDLGLKSNITLIDGKTDNIEYKYYAEPRDDGGTIHFYFINRDGDTYVLHFVSKYDIKDFEEKMLKSVEF